MLTWEEEHGASIIARPVAIIVLQALVIADRALQVGRHTLRVGLLRHRARRRGKRLCVPRAGATMVTPHLQTVDKPLLKLQLTPGILVVSKQWLP
eukprot:360443-Chlamydomonas_euryale.AAC.3